MVREHDERIYASYWAARWQREKEMTPLGDVLVGRSAAKAEPEREQTPDEMQRAFDMLVVMTGGTLGGGDKKKRRRGKRAGKAAGAAE